MRRLVITENYGLWTVETSDGKRGVGATFDTALAKLLPLHSEAQNVMAVFDGIRPTQSGQMHHGIKGTT